MKIPFENFSLFVETEYFNPNKTTILFIHGFTGSSKDWGNILPQIDKSFSCIAIDLIGHGQASSPEKMSYYKIESIIQQIKKVIDEFKIDNVILTGYSMGGRVAMSFANAYPGIIRGLILESTTAGIEDGNERTERLENDKVLSQKILDEGIEKFVEFWMNIPIFSSQKRLSKNELEEIRRNKLSNNPIGLSNSLLGFSTGKMLPLWNKLHKFNLPVLLLAGELDSKYSIINQKMHNLLTNSEFHTAKNTGHNIHLEKPSEFIILVNSFLQSSF